MRELPDCPIRLKRRSTRASKSEENTDLQHPNNAAKRNNRPPGEDVVDFLQNDTDVVVWLKQAGLPAARSAPIQSHPRSYMLHDCCERISDPL
jgi:hypothetical protein